MNIEAIESEIKKLEKERNKTMELLFFEGNIESNKRIELVKIYKEIKNKIDIKKNELYKLLTTKKPYLTDGVIDIYKSMNNKEINYIIYLANTDERIGFIDYRKYDSAIGNIGYGIDLKYRGNHYALNALRLIEQDFTSDVTICAKKDNISSIKTIEAFGGILVNIKDDILVYKYKIKEEKNEKKFN